MGSDSKIDPRTWRISQGLTQRELAQRAGINGRNPSRTYDRYERGISDCPAAVVEAVRIASAGVVGAEAWHAVRLSHLQRKERAA